MDKMPIRDEEIVESTARRLRELGGSAPRSTSPASALCALVLIGDALRLGLEVPAEIMRGWLGLPPPLLREALTLQASELELVVAEAPIEIVDVISTRDCAESLRCMLLRKILDGDGAAGGSPEALALEAACHACDAVLSAFVSESDVERIFGPRPALGAAWAAAFPDPIPGSHALTLRQPKLGLVDSYAVPDDERVTAYVTRGALPRYVEGVASSNVRFAEVLAASIDALDIAREPVSEAARAWRWRGRVGARRRGGQRWLLATGVVLVAAAAMVLALTRSGLESDARRTAQHEADIAARQAALDRQVEDLRQRELSAEREQERLARTELANATSEEARTAAKAKIAELEAKQKWGAAYLTGVTDAPRRPSGVPSARATPRIECECDAGDVLCSCF